MNVQHIMYHRSCIQIVYLGIRSLCSLHGSVGLQREGKHEEAEDTFKTILTLSFLSEVGHDIHIFNLF